MASGPVHIELRFNFRPAMEAFAGLYHSVSRLAAGAGQLNAAQRCDLAQAGRLGLVTPLSSVDIHVALVWLRDEEPNASFGDEEFFAAYNDLASAGFGPSAHRCVREAWARAKDLEAFGRELAT
jgi:hypothetical protein